MNPESDRLGPRPIGFLTVVLRALGGLGGGLIGTGLIMVIAFLGAGILDSALGGTEDGAVHPLFVFVFLAMMFIGSATANILGPLFMGLSDRNHYRRLATSLTQIFIANVVILVLIAPIYMVVASLNIDLIFSVAALQVVVSAFASSLILEIIADDRYALLGVYSTAFAVLVSTGLYFMFYTFSGGEASLFLLFLALPVMWTSIGCFNGLLNFFYGWIYKLYGVDFLSRITIYGDDEHWEAADEVEKKEAAAEARAEDTGAHFLNKK